MKTFEFNIIETLEKTVQVQAETKEEAYRYAWEQYNSGKEDYFILTPENITNTDIQFKAVQPDLFEGTENG